MMIRMPFKRSTRVTLTCGASKTRPEFAPSCDIPSIVTGRIAAAFVRDPRQAKFGDFSEVSFDAALSRVQDVTDFFESLPSKVRDRFGSNVQRFIAFASDPANLEECYALGIYERPARAVADGAPVADRVAGAGLAADTVADLDGSVTGGDGD